MAAYTTTSTGGDITNSGSFVSGLPGSNGDTVTIANGATLTVSTNLSYTLGGIAIGSASGAISTLHIVNGGVLTIASASGNALLQGYGDLKIDGGGTLTTSGSNPARWHGYNTNGTRGGNLIFGDTTSGLRATVAGGSAAACIFFDSNAKYNSIVANNCDFSYVGNGSNNGIQPYGSEATVTFSDCTFTHCGGNTSSGAVIDSGSAMTATAVWSFERCFFTGTTAAYNLYIFTGGVTMTTGTRLIDSCSFDKTTSAHTAYAQFTITNNFFATLPNLYLAALEPSTKCLNNVLRQATSSAATYLTGSMVDNLIVCDVTATDPNVIQLYNYSGVPIVTQASTTAAGATTIPLTSALTGWLPAGTFLLFGAVSCYLTSAANVGDTSLSVQGFPALTGGLSGSIAASTGIQAAAFHGNVYQVSTTTSTNPSNSALFYAATTYSSMTFPYTPSVSIVGNLVLPNNKTSGTSGSLWNITNGQPKAFIVHNTICVDTGGATGGFYGSIYLGDGSGNPSAYGTLAVVSNLAYSATAAGGYRNHLVQYSSTAANADTVYGPEVGYNGGYNLDNNTATYTRMTTVTTGYGTGYPGYMFAATPLADSTDVRGNPNFVDSARGVDKAYWAFYGQNGGVSTGSRATDFTDCLSYLQALTTGVCAVGNGSMVASLIAWIRAGFASTNTIYHATAHDGGDIGAFAWQSAFNPAWAMGSSLSF